jgi:glutamate carboxypeptidase
MDLLVKEQLDWIASEQNQMKSLLVALSEENSGSLYIEGIQKCFTTFDQACDSLESDNKRVMLPKWGTYNELGEKSSHEMGEILVYAKRLDAPVKVLLSGHMDTVFPPSSSFQKTSEEQGVLKGPGVADMKGGLIIMLKALEAFERFEGKNTLGWQFVISPDEEIGSPGSAKLLSKWASDFDVGCIAEPALPGGELAKTRKGSLNFSVFIKGKSAHVGRCFDEGRSAIVAIARLIQLLDEGNKMEGLTVNTGKILGGEARNVVPPSASCQVNVRFGKESSEKSLRDWIDLQLKKVEEETGCLCRLENWLMRPAKPLTSQIESMFEGFQQCASELGMPPLSWKDTGGVCDGNILAASGLPTIDNLGVKGGEIHTEDEFMVLSSLTSQAQLLFLFFVKLALKEIQL